jgi:hypothetical protein
VTYRHFLTDCLLQPGAPFFNDWEADGSTTPDTPYDEDCVDQRSTCTASAPSDVSAQPMNIMIEVTGNALVARCLTASSVLARVTISAGCRWIAVLIGCTSGAEHAAA